MTLMTVLTQAFSLVRTLTSAALLAFGILPRPGCKFVGVHVLRACHCNEILRAVIGFATVDVVNYLIRSQWTAMKLLPNVAVFKHIPLRMCGAMNHDVTIVMEPSPALPPRVSRTLVVVRCVAAVGAERAGLSTTLLLAQGRCFALKGSAAVRTFQFDHRGCTLRGHRNQPSGVGLGVLTHRRGIRLSMPDFTMAMGFRGAF
jgi:hypothetical protein